MHVRRLIHVLAEALLAVIVPLLACTSASAQTPAVRTVVTIHWGAEGFPGTAVLDASIRSVLLSDAGTPVNYYAEYLESEDFPPDRASEALRDYIRRKFQDRRIDLVIPVSTPALRFALRYRADLFPDAPIVFVTGSKADFVDQRATPAVTGVVSDGTFAETMELALHLHPSVRRVFVVAKAPTAERYEERLHAALDRFSSRVTLTYVNAPTVASLLDAVRAIPPGGLIFYTRYAAQPPEKVLYSAEVARLMAEVSHVPIYGTTDLYIGTGVVGGMMRGSHVTGARVGEMARRVLNGTRPEDLPVEDVLIVPTFDWRQLGRWGIDLSRLPPGSEIQFRPPTLWESYRRVVVATIAVVAAQLVLIGALLTQRARRRRAEQTIRAREATLRTSYERIRQLAQHLINVQDRTRAEIAQDLHDDVCQRLAYVAIGVANVKRSPGDIQDERTQRKLDELEQDTQRVFDEIRRLSHELHPATLRVLGLGPAIKAHGAELAKRHNVHVDFEIAGELGPVHPETAICFFHIAQEAFRNGIVHGHASRFAVSLAKSGEEIVLRISDDGAGFDREAVRHHGGGLGLVSMEERARSVGGHLEIVASPGQGTTVRARGPAQPPSTARPAEDPRLSGTRSSDQPAALN